MYLEYGFLKSMWRSPSHLKMFVKPFEKPSQIISTLMLMGDWSLRGRPTCVLELVTHTNGFLYLILQYGHINVIGSNLYWVYGWLSYLASVTLPYQCFALGSVVTLTYLVTIRIISTWRLCYNSLLQSGFLCL